MVSSGRAVLRRLATIRAIFSTFARQLIRADAAGGCERKACTDGRAHKHFVSKAHSLWRVSRV